MKKNFLLLAAFSFCLATASQAQVSTTPEVPRNYKPKPKELLAMPGELTDEMIFPVLGKYEYTDKSGTTADITITRDAENKGVIWVNGMPQGKFKADLKASPSTYRIPVQKTLQNDVEADAMAPTEEMNDDTKIKTKTAKRFSGKSLQEGTLIFDSTSSKLYVNVGSKFNEENPSYVFPDMAVSDTTSMEIENGDDTAKPIKPKKKATPVKGNTYVLTKVVAAEVMPADATSTDQAPAGN